MAFFLLSCSNACHGVLSVVVFYADRKLTRTVLHFSEARIHTAAIVFLAIPYQNGFSEPLGLLLWKYFIDFETSV